MTVKEATFEMFRRYNTIMQPLEFENKGRLVLMCIHAISHPEYPIDKLSRWLGFVQGVLYSNNIIDLDEERDFSRKLFKQAYKDQGIEIPKSVDVMQEVIDTWE
jgi:deoxyribodipyrimidine photolyase